MGEISDTIQNIAKQELARQAQDFTEENSEKYKIRLMSLYQQIQQQINKDEMNTYFDMSVAQQMKNQIDNQNLEELKAHYSKKTGAYITDDGHIEDQIEKINDIFKDSNFKSLSDKRGKRSIELAKFIQLTAEAMNVVYNLRQDIGQTLEERLGLTYIGATSNSNQLKMLVIPMHLLLINFNNFINIGIDSDTKELALTISTSQNLITNLQNVNGVVGLDLTTDLLKEYFKRIKIKRSEFKTGDYDVIGEKDYLTQSGFISEALGRLKFGVDKKFTYRQDNGAWQKHSDYTLFSDNGEKIGISHKNVAPAKEHGLNGKKPTPSSPTLLRLNGFINNTLPNLINILNRPFNEQSQELKKEFDISSEANQLEQDAYKDLETMARQKLSIKS